MIVFWAAVALLAYVYLGYPLLAAARAWLFPKPRRTASIEPLVSVVVSAYNEESRIAARIENLLALEYPREKLEILVASDGSTDGTVRQARRYQDRGVTVRGFGRRQGKSAVINAVVPMLRGDVIVFADARQRFDRDSVRALVRNFADPSIGGVSGELVIEANGAATMTPARGTALYWRYEKFIRSTEGRRDSTIGATGAIYAIRRELFEPIPEDTLLDDVLIPLRIVKRGFRVVFEGSARAYDVAAVAARQEFVRKARTSAGLFQLFAREPWLLNPRRNRIWFQTISHKGLRLTLPVLHVAAFVANATLVGAWPYDMLFAAQMLFYAAAAVGYTRSRGDAVFSIPWAICLHIWVIVVGFHRFVTNRQPATWERVVPASSGGDVPVRIRPASAGRSEAA